MEVIVENFVVDVVLRKVPSDNCSLITVEISSISSDGKVVDFEIFTFTFSICSATTSMIGETVDTILSLGTFSRTQSVVVCEIDVAVSPWTSLAP